MTRVLVLATLLFATTIALGGIAETPELAPATTASCTSVDLGDVQTGCIEAAVCRAVEEATKQPMNCIE